MQDAGSRLGGRAGCEHLVVVLQQRAQVVVVGTTRDLVADAVPAQDVPEVGQGGRARSPFAAVGKLDGLSHLS